MAVVLSALASVGWALGLAFVVFSLACGLYVISEWVEEYPRQTRQLIQGAVWAVDAVHVLALADGLSAWRIAVSVAANHVYAANLARFPLVSLSSATFLGSCVLAVGNHFVWFFYFISNLRIPFEQVCSFMFFGVWLVPLALFVSLTPMDAALPSSHDAEGRTKTRQNMFKTIVSCLRRADEQLPQSLHND
ncbi:erv26 super protein [Coemansia sp. RSA 2706]|nr:erv26 super protein [Coemansia sp. RSA 2711]KAJ1844532.1 erv26 super protein [Coemansia sp. RSA 2708]KAJ2307528.1 erv26 super protein [Coemansia sp. RSA 2706]KAJ2308658.1 erv26 super protein [Coemansia sp. RSA 2705]KAJ2312412.1 erv26 super protein [Coemansia sp. RSA 2704]KAJ2329637.1 erv26 super protein [Coemansia sp. RSA 2702]KAJ2387293.1 erv26 super protein [Coemansia sp. RSA 2611]